MHHPRWQVAELVEPVELWFCTFVCFRCGICPPAAVWYNMLPLSWLYYGPLPGGMFLCCASQCGVEYPSPRYGATTAYARTLAGGAGDVLVPAGIAGMWLAGWLLNGLAPKAPGFWSAYPGNGPGRISSHPFMTTGMAYQLALAVVPPDPRMP